MTLYKNLDITDLILNFLNPDEEAKCRRISKSWYLNILNRQDKIDLYKEFPNKLFLLEDWKTYFNKDIKRTRPLDKLFLKHQLSSTCLLSKQNADFLKKDSSIFKVDDETISELYKNRVADTHRVLEIPIGTTLEEILDLKHLGKPLFENNMRVHAYKLSDILYEYDAINALKNSYGKKPIRQTELVFISLEDSAELYGSAPIKQEDELKKMGYSVATAIYLLAFEAGVIKKDMIKGNEEFHARLVKNPLILPDAKGIYLPSISRKLSSSTEIRLEEFDPTDTHSNRVYAPLKKFRPGFGYLNGIPHSSK